MKNKTTWIIGIVVLIIVVVFLSKNIYTSSPGLTLQEYTEEFFANKPTCHGIDILLNEEATWVDAPGRSLCIGYLKYSEPMTVASDGVLTAENLTTLQNQLDRKNRDQDFLVYPNEHASTPVGSYSGMDIEEQYWCSDVCPDNGILYLNISSSTEDSCGDLGGNRLYKWGRGLQYVGCSPTENKYSD